jgi:ferric-dicitrate binding protein FerR (iron transport regulator)
MSGHTDTEMNLSELDEVEHVTALLLKQLRQEITEDELQDLNNRMTAHPLWKQVQDRINNEKQLLADLLVFNQVDKEGWWKKISGQENLRMPSRSLFQRWPSYLAAALILIAAVFTCWYFIASKKQKSTNEKYVPVIINVPPGGNKASLTLSNGDVINLDNAANGTVAEEGNAKVIKLQNGEVEYEPASANRSEIINYNTLSTPRGGQYHLVLPDGSKVWLNAASSITYPTYFTGHDRRVTITGEVYFEVAEKKRPFIVDVLPSLKGEAGGDGICRIEVLGTIFNVTAYEDENVIKTTLLKGKVKIVNRQSSIPVRPGHPDGGSQQSGADKQQTAILLPGQQAQLSTTTSGAGPESIKIIDGIDTDMAVAWKNGLHSFKNADIKSIMRMLGRWYNIDIVYEGNIPNYKFTGSIPRSENMSSVLSMLQYAGMHFKLRDGKIVVIP